MKISAKRELSWVSKEKAEYEWKIRELERQREVERTKSFGAIATLTHTINDLRADLNETFTQDMAHRSSGTFIFRIVVILIVGGVIGAAGMLAAMRYTSLAMLARPESALNEESQPSNNNQALTLPAPADGQGSVKSAERNKRHNK